MRRPQIRFMHTDTGAVAYQRWGTGERTILNLAEWIGSVENSWEHPAHLRLWEVYGSVGQCVRFDYRGFGMSDPLSLPAIGQPQAWATDAVSLLDHLEVDRVTLIGEGSAAAAAVVLATQHTHRIERLVLGNCAPCGAVAAGRPREAVAATAEWVRLQWGTGQVIAAGSRDLGQDMNFAAYMERTGARPAVAGRMIEVTAEQDMRGLLPSVDVETLVIHTGDLTAVPLARTKAVADAIPGAKFSSSQTTSFYWGADDSAFVNFISGGDWGGGERDLVVVAFTDIVGSTEAAAVAGDTEWRRTLDLLDHAVESEVRPLGGRIVKGTGDGHLLEFARPGAALEALAGVLRRGRMLGVHLRAGAHLGEIERRTDGDLGGLAVHVCARISALADAGELLVSSTVADTVAGGGWHISDRGLHELRGISKPWHLYDVAIGEH